MQTIRFLLILALSISLLLIAMLQPAWISNPAQNNAIKIENPKSNWQLYQSAEWRTNKQGEHAYLVADKITGYDTPKKMELKQPFLIHQTQDNLYTLTAENAVAFQSKPEDIIQFTNQVQAYQYAPTAPFTVNLQLDAQALAYYSQTKQLISEGMATIKQPGLLVSGMNLNAQIDTKYFSFQAPVKTLYSPQTDNSL